MNTRPTQPQGIPGQPRAIHDCWNKIGVWGDGDCPELQRFVHCRNCPVYSSAAGRLLDRDLPPDYIQEWTGHFARETASEHVARESGMIFRIAHEWLALSTAAVVEVAESRPIHHLPHRRDAALLGIVNIRGELVVCLSLAQALGIKSVSTGRDTGQRKRATFERLIVAGTDSGPLVFPVDEIHGIHRYDSTSLRPAPATLPKSAADYTLGILSWKERSVGVLNHPVLFGSLNRILA